MIDEPIVAGAADVLVEDRIAADVDEAGRLPRLQLLQREAIAEPD